ncbi:MAG: tetratricopeptide repeat protein [Candidatus Zixiibacteriota bacterium]
MTHRTISIIILLFSAFVLSSCTSIYFNTFHNVRKNFNDAEKTRKKDGRDNAKGGEIQKYNIAITKASKVLEKHPTSSWVDDALYIIGTAYYYLGEYSNSSRKFKELLANYPESEFIPRSRVLLAKAKLKLKEETEAIVIFEEIFAKSKDKKMKADAARALGEYYFEAQDYENANLYFQSLIDSLGEDKDKLRALIYVGNGYFERYNIKPARENYNKALNYSPDTLDYYRLQFKLAECDYFLFNIRGGLQTLQLLADNELYYDSLAPIRLKMAEGYEWDGDLESAINTYEQVSLENPGKEASAVAYYELALIYQYDFEDLIKARSYFNSAREERRQSSVYEDATKRASQLALLEEYMQMGGEEKDQNISLDDNSSEMELLSENQFNLGELYYYDLDKQDSAISAFQALLQRFPNSRHAPRALIAMSYIYENDLFDTTGADSLLRLVLSDYAHFDEAEIVIDKLGLAGTVADTGYALVIYRKAENFLEEFQNLDKEWYFPFEGRITPPIDTTSSVDTSKMDGEEITPSDTLTEDGDIVESETTDTTSSVFVPDTKLFDSTVQTGEAIRLTDLMRQSKGETTESKDSKIDPNDSLSIPDSLPFPEPQPGRDMQDSLIVQDSLPLSKLPGQLNNQTGKSLPKDDRDDFDRLRGRNLAQTGKDSLLKSTDNLSAEKPVLEIDKTPADSLKIQGTDDLISDSLDASKLNIIDADSTAFINFNEMSEKVDSFGVFGTSDQPLDTVPRDKAYYHALGLIDSARFYYQYVVDSFPQSEHSIQARYLLLWTYDNYFAPGDSLLIDLYSAFVDSFPQSEFTKFIGSEYRINPSPEIARQIKKRDKPIENPVSPEDAPSGDEQPFASEEPADTLSPELKAISKFITDADGKQLPPANEYFLAENYAFEYPLEAVAARIEDNLYFQIRIDFTGKVEELVLMNPTSSPELNERISETVKNTLFNNGLIPPELYDTWFYYKREVRIPNEFKQ